MTRITTIRSLAIRVLAYAEALVPKHASQWGQAMRCEMQQIDRDTEALEWALGCFVASIKARFGAMNLGTLRVSRCVLTLEMAMCFVPLTLGWLDIVFGRSGIARLDAALITAYFLQAPSGATMLTLVLIEAIVGVIGPVGAVLALRVIALNRPLRGDSLSKLLVHASILIGVVLLAQTLLLDSMAGIAEVAGVLVLFSALPAAGFAHLSYLGRALDREATA
jgi:hypothetical protein